MTATMTVTENRAAQLLTLDPVVAFCEQYGFKHAAFAPSPGWLYVSLTSTKTTGQFRHQGELEFRFNKFGLIGATLYAVDDAGSYAIDLDSDGRLQLIQTDGYKRMLSTKLGRDLRDMLAAVVKLTGSRMDAALAA